MKTMARLFVILMLSAMVGQSVFAAFGGADQCRRVMHKAVREVIDSRIEEEGHDLTEIRQKYFWNVSIFDCCESLGIGSDVIDKEFRGPKKQKALKLICGRG